MITKLTIKSSDKEEFDELVDTYRQSSQKISDSNPDTTYTLFVDEDNLTLIVKCLNLAEQVN